MNRADIDRAAVDILERDTYGRIAMTEEERQELSSAVLIKRLRRHDPFPSWQHMYDDAADEIERLAAELAKLREARWKDHYPDIPFPGYGPRQ